jgi:WD40 repeat protein
MLTQSCWEHKFNFSPFIILSVRQNEFFFGTMGHGFSTPFFLSSLTSDKKIFLWDLRTFFFYLLLDFDIRQVRFTHRGIPMFSQIRSVTSSSPLVYEMLTASVPNGLWIRRLVYRMWSLSIQVMSICTGSRARDRKWGLPPHPSL